MAVAPMGATLESKNWFSCTDCGATWSDNGKGDAEVCPNCRSLHVRGHPSTFEAVKPKSKNNYKIEITGFDKKSIPTFRSGKHPAIATITLFIYGAKDEQSAIKKAIEDNKSRIRKVGFLGPSKKCAVSVTRVRQDGNEIGSKTNKYTVTAESFERKSNGMINLVELLDPKYRKLARFDSASLAELND